MVVVIMVVAGIHTLRSSGGELLSCFSNGKNEKQKPRTQNAKLKTKPRAYHDTGGGTISGQRDKNRRRVSRT
jgi:hypothetical protein